MVGKLAQETKSVLSGSVPPASRQSLLTAQFDVPKRLAGDDEGCRQITRRNAARCGTQAFGDDRLHVVVAPARDRHRS